MTEALRRKASVRESKQTQSQQTKPTTQDKQHLEVVSSNPERDIFSSTRAPVSSPSQSQIYHSASRYQPNATSYTYSLTANRSSSKGGGGSSSGGSSRSGSSGSSRSGGSSGSSKSGSSSGSSGSSSKTGSSGSSSTGSSSSQGPSGSSSTGSSSRSGSSGSSSSSSSSSPSRGGSYERRTETPPSSGYEGKRSESSPYEDRKTESSSSSTRTSPYEGRKTETESRTVPSTETQKREESRTEQRRFPSDRVESRERPKPDPVQREAHGYARHNRYSHDVHPRDGSGHHDRDGHDHRSGGNHHHTYHPRGYDTRGLPNGYWQYDWEHGWRYVPWDSNRHGNEHYHDYFSNPRYHYHRQHHYYWHNRDSWDYHYYPPSWGNTYVIIVPPSQYDPVPRYEGPQLALRSVGDLNRQKKEVDRLRYELYEVPTQERDSDSYRFRVKDVLDNYHYLINQVYQQATGYEGREYQEVVESIWEESLALLNFYEAEAPYDSSMRADSVTVLYSNLRDTELLRRWDSQRENPFYKELFDRIGRQIQY